MWRTSKNAHGAMAQVTAHAEVKLAVHCVVEHTTSSMGDTTAKEKVSAQSVEVKAQ